LKLHITRSAWVVPSIMGKLCSFTSKINRLKMQKNRELIVQFKEFCNIHSQGSKTWKHFQSIRVESLMWNCAAPCTHACMHHCVAWGCCMHADCSWWSQNQQLVAVSKNQNGIRVWFSELDLELGSWLL
jgi:hypothetical protein